MCVGVVGVCSSVAELAPPRRSCQHLLETVRQRSPIVTASNQQALPQAAAQHARESESAPGLAIPWPCPELALERPFLSLTAFSCLTHTAAGTVRVGSQQCTFWLGISQTHPRNGSPSPARRVSLPASRDNCRCASEPGGGSYP